MSTVHVVVRQADVGSVEIDGVYADWDDATYRQSVLQAEDGDSYTSWVEEHELQPADVRGSRPLEQRP